MTPEDSPTEPAGEQQQLILAGASAAAPAVANRARATAQQEDPARPLSASTSVALLARPAAVAEAEDDEEFGVVAAAPSCDHHAYVKNAAAEGRRASLDSLVVARRLPERFGGLLLSCNSEAEIATVWRMLQGGDALRACVTVRFLSGSIAFGPWTFPRTFTVGELKFAVDARRRFKLVLGKQILPDDTTLEELPEEAALGAVFEGHSEEGEEATAVVAETSAAAAADAEELDAFDVSWGGHNHRGGYPLRFVVLAALRQFAAYGVSVVKVPPSSYKALRLDVAGSRCTPAMIKRIEAEGSGQGLPEEGVREATLLRDLQRLRHPNVVELLEIFATQGALFLVFELLDMDLRTYLTRRGPFSTPATLRCAARQVFEAVQCCHLLWILHQNVCPMSFLVSHSDEEAPPTLKLADFSNAARLSPTHPFMVEAVGYIWYLAPELLLGQEDSCLASDVWSLGCTLAEMATGQPLFGGCATRIGTLFDIFQLLGTPDESAWPGVTRLCWFSGKFPKWAAGGGLAQLLREEGPGLDADGADLLEACLAYPPDQRPPANRWAQYSFLQTG